MEVAVVRVAAKLVDGRSLGQVLMAFARVGGPLRGSWLSVLSARSSPLPAGEEDLRSPLLREGPWRRDIPIFLRNGLGDIS